MSGVQAFSLVVFEPTLVVIVHQFYCSRPRYDLGCYSRQVSLESSCYVAVFAAASMSTSSSSGVIGITSGGSGLTSSSTSTASASTVTTPSTSVTPGASLGFEQILRTIRAAVQHEVATALGSHSFGLPSSSTSTLATAAVSPTGVVSTTSTSAVLPSSGTSLFHDLQVLFYR